jgi:hypothetical protein
MSSVMVINVYLGYADSIGTANSEEEAQKEKSYIQGLALDL